MITKQVIKHIWKSGSKLNYLFSSGVLLFQFFIPFPILFQITLVQVLKNDKVFLFVFRKTAGPLCIRCTLVYDRDLNMILPNRTTLKPKLRLTFSRQNRNTETREQNSIFLIFASGTAMSHTVHDTVFTLQPLTFTKCHILQM